jgi:hypothetical protein
VGSPDQVRDGVTEIEMEFGRRDETSRDEADFRVRVREMESGPMPIPHSRFPIPDRYYTILILTYRNVGHSFRIDRTVHACLLFGLAAMTPMTPMIAMTMSIHL